MKAVNSIVALQLLLAAIAYAAVPQKYLRTRGDDIDNFIRPQKQYTNMPVVGVLTLPVTVPSQRKHGNSSYATSYARWLEAGGARIVPILYDSTPEELDYLLKRINGVFWTGGLVEFNPSLTDPEGAKYLRSTEYVWKHVVAENKAGNYFPMWGTCLGYERMSQLFANDTTGEILSDVDAENLDINLELTTAGWLSRLFGGMRYDLFKQVASPVGHLAFNNHGLGIHPDTFASTSLSKFFRVLSIDEDRNGVPFVSTVEGREYPFYGTQWHPEKAPWEWNPKYRMDHSETAVEFSNYLGRFFVNECKYNKNYFEDPTLLARIVVANWPSLPTGKIHGLFSSYSEITFFGKRYAKQFIDAAEKEASKSLNAIRWSRKVSPA